MLCATSTTIRAFILFKCAAAKPQLCSKTHIYSRPGSLYYKFSMSACRSPPREVHLGDGADGSITLQEWQGWGTISPIPALVTDIVEDMKILERDIDSHMSFGGLGGKLKGHFGVQEDKKHRATYQALGDSEKKLQFFSARQIACRLLGSKGYLCQKCWLPMEDCMCSKVRPCSLWHRIRFWLYMHPKDFLRQNNTGKLLWQVFGVEAATLCLFGIAEHEEIMWNSFKLAGKGKVWCLYPNKGAVLKSVQDAFDQDLLENSDCTQSVANEDETLNFILIDGTWSNSAAMFRRLKEQAKTIWGEEELPCITLAAGASAMHKLRPQPSWDRTCTAAAAVGLLSELQLLQQFSSWGLDKQAEAVEDALEVLLEALTTRRLRMGRSITRKVRHSTDIC
ncbi:DTW domain-containing protein [Quillaja saponaria]|uniref:tRNA-uridine aminocarboxypropyltransferase n=1 Tax=Quillaja saponaria TaxID=32244 RepID=A0AAD7QH73_QUISA|nr:DTW domain-containing protein [Quillaja saponaria]